MKNRNEHLYVHTVSFQLCRTELPPPPPLPAPPLRILLSSSCVSCQRLVFFSLFSPSFSLPFTLLLFLLHFFISQCVMRRQRGNEGGYLHTSAENRCRASVPPHFVYRCLCDCVLVCVCTECTCDWVLSQPANRWNTPLQRIGVILKCWHEDYYSIQLHQICTVLKWYSTSLSSWLIYSFKWALKSHVLEWRP